MAFHYSLQKVMEHKDREKSEAEKQYSDAIDQFETVATKLYETLKQKEDLQKRQADQLGQGLPIAEIQHHEQVLTYLQKEIDTLQWKTQRARKMMTDKERLLVSKSIDVKKYERMKDIKYEEYKEQEKQEETKFLDEISVQQFVRR